MLWPMTSAVHISEQQADYLDTEKATAQTVHEMGRLVLECADDPLVLQATINAVDGRMGFGQSRALCESVWAWLKRNVQFVSDEEQLSRLLGRGDELELLIAPSVLLRARDRQGDCDDFTMLACALLACLGVPPLIKTYKCDRSDPSRWSHVCAAAILEDGSVFPVDASHGEYAGWEVPAEHTYESQLWDLSGNRVPGGNKTMRRSRGLSGYVANPDWTGNEMTTTQGRVAGPYANLDVMRAWYPGPRNRRAGLAAIGAAKFRGMGVTGPDGTPIDVPDTSGVDYTGIFDPANLPAPSSDSSGFNWNSFVSSLIGSGTKLGSQALATPGTITLPNGTVITGSPQGTSALPGGLGISSGTLITIALILGGVLLLKSK